MRKFIKFVIYLVAVIGVCVAHAGSYDDYFAAIKRDDPDAVVSLLNRGFDPNTINAEGIHGLYLALREPALKVADVLIDWPKTNLDWRTPKDETPLMMAALKGHTQQARRLIDKGADVNKTGWTPLHYAATNGHLAIIDLLLEHHAFIDAESPNGTTPLMMAAHYGTPAAVKLLLESGADPKMKNQLGLTAIDFAHRGNRKDSADLIAAAIRSKNGKGKW